MTPLLKAALAAPSVKEADGHFLRPEMMPLGPTVAVSYEAMKAGDKVSLFWEGSASHTAHWHAERTLVSDNEECHFVVPFIRLLESDASDVTVRYVVRRSGSATDEDSLATDFSVRDYPWLSEPWMKGESFQGNSVLPDALWIDVGLPDEFSSSLEAGDKVFVWLMGSHIDGYTSYDAEAATSAMLAITPQNAGLPVRFRFGRQFVVANYGRDVFVRCEVLRRSGYIQHPMTDAGQAILKYAEALSPVQTPGLIGNILALDELNGALGFPVAVLNQTETMDANVTFFLDSSATESYLGGTGTSVEGSIPLEMLELHADRDCVLFCTAARKGTDGQETTALSPRRTLSVRRTRVPDPFPSYDPGIELPTIDGIRPTTLDVPQDPNGPFARIPHGNGFSEGDVVTIVFRTRSGLVTWKESITIASENAQEDIVRRIDRGFLIHNQNTPAWLYYSIKSSTGDERFSKPLVTRIGPYLPRFFHFDAFWIMNMEGAAAIIEMDPNGRGQFGLNRNNMRVYAGDQIVITAQGRHPDASMQIHITVDEDSTDWLFVDLPQDLITMNAGYGILHRASRISGSYIEHSPWKSTPVLPFPEGTEGSRATLPTELADVFVTASSLSRQRQA